MTAERLRQAATLLRTRTSAASSAPWEPFPWRDDDAYYGPRVFGPVPSAWVAETSPGQQGREDALYIATMHPPVALALADWLDDYGNTLEVFGDSDRTRDNTPALRLADAILREA